MSAPSLPAIVLLSACAAGAGCGPSSSAEFRAVQAIFDTHCAGCHDPDARVSGSNPDLPLTGGRSHAALVDRPAHETCGGTLVVPGAPASSYLLAKVTDDPPCEGKRMPSAEVGTREPLSQADLDIIAAWITAGAPD